MSGEAGAGTWHQGGADGLKGAKKDGTDYGALGKCNNTGESGGADTREHAGLEGQRWDNRYDQSTAKSSCFKSINQDSKAKDTTAGEVMGRLGVRQLQISFGSCFEVKYKVTFMYIVTAFSFWSVRPESLNPKQCLHTSL